MELIKTQPVVVADPKRDEYSLTWRLNHRRNWKKMRPEQQKVILLAAADYLEAEAAGMREQAEALVNGH